MPEDQKADTLPDTRDQMAPDDQGLYDAIETSYKDDPASIPAKFHEADNPVLAYMRSYKGLEQKLHSKTQETPSEEPTEAPQGEVELPEVVDFDAPPEVGDKNFDWAVRETTRNGGKLTPEVITYLEETHKMDKTARSFFEKTIAGEIRRNVETAAQVVGGAENLKALNQWVMKNRSRQQIDAINKALHDEATRDLTLRGLMAESKIGLAPKPTIETSPVPGADAAKPYQSQAELTKDLTNPVLKDRWHPDHQATNAKIQARIKATPPGVLM